MNNKTLLELAVSWGIAAAIDLTATAERRATLRECADMLRALVQIDELERSGLQTMPVPQIPEDDPAVRCCVHCMRSDVEACPSDESCDAGMDRRIDALTDELTPAEWRVYQRRCIDALLSL